MPTDNVLVRSPAAVSMALQLAKRSLRRPQTSTLRMQLALHFMTESLLMSKYPLVVMLLHWPRVRMPLWPQRQRLIA